MKLSSVLTCGAVLVSSSATAFTVVQPSPRTATQQHMFGGGGAAAPTEDDPEAVAKVEAAARSMGMSVEEYQLGLSARLKLNENLNDMRVSGGDEATVAVERDGQNPPIYMKITITEKGKALGQETVSKELCAALKDSAEKSRAGRSEAQKGMMQFIGEEMKRLGMDQLPPVS